ncbi:MAG TPA: single-stranded-DNA-specific exonuclease RecJ [Peptococcaceae bacterium]|nr:MAG: Exonuclease RecJ [Moorella sp. 60_41]HBT46649.1 single-stranded-DNA-specific exonuclease RecJ [Peptococcaceae bacterium]
MTRARWKVHAPDFILQGILARALDISPVTAQVLINRGVKTVEEARTFLSGGVEDLGSPYALPGMEQAVERMGRAARSGEKVLVYGDYDVDGLTSAVLLGETLAKLGAGVEFYIPHRLEEGYGLKTEGLSWGLGRGCTLAVTVDCGITAVAEAAWAVEHGLDLIITDHHRPLEELPAAVALVNPWLAPGLSTPLAGAGVAFKVAQGLAELFGLRAEGIPAGWALDLAALGTVADAVPLLGENRLLVRAGLEILREARRPGIRALLEAAGLRPEELSAERIAFVLAPRLNAAGRLGSARPALDLLLASSPQQAWELAQALNRENQTRQLLEEQVLNEALAQAQVALERGEPGVVLASPGWHPGVLGIVASRLAERLGRPAVLIALGPEGRGRGSGRSSPGIDLFSVVQACSEYLSACGGHGQAVGLEITADQVAPFREAFLAALEAACTGEAPQPMLELEAEVLFSQIDKRLVEELEALAPFGEENPRPLFLYRGAQVGSLRAVGNGGVHIKFRLLAEGKELPAIAFNMAVPEGIGEGSRIDVAFRPVIDRYNGREEVELVLADLRPAESPPIVVVGDKRPWAKEGLAVAAWPQEVPGSREGEGQGSSTWAAALLEEVGEYWKQGKTAGYLVFASGRGVLACYHGLRSLRALPEGELLPRGPWLAEEKLRSEAPRRGIILQPVELLEVEGTDQEGWQLWSPETGENLPGARLWSSGGGPEAVAVEDPVRCAWEKASKGERTVLYAAGFPQARRLARFFREQGLKVVLDEGLTPHQEGLVRRASLAGEVCLLVGVGSRPAWFYPARTVVFTYLPQGREEMELSLPPHPERPEVYVGVQCLREEPPGSAALPPFLRRLYRRLASLGSGEDGVCLDRKVLGGYLVRCGINILEELGLVRLTEGSGGTRVRLTPGAGEKRDLHNSWRYRQLCRDYQLALDLWRELRGLRR